MGNNHFFFDLITTLECFFLVTLFFFLYFKKIINSTELILYSFSCSTFFISYISETITPMFFVTTYFFVVEFTLLYRNKTKLKLSFLLILILPVISSIIIAILIIAGIDIFDGYNPTVIRIFYDAVFFYVKYFLPLVFLGSRIYREASTNGLDNFFLVMKRVAIISCYIALFQFFVSLVIKDDLVLRIIGMRPNYVSFSANGEKAVTARISAFFVEPKAFASYLIVTLPLFINGKNIKNIFLILVVGILTSSQTFTAGIILIFIIFFFLKKMFKRRAIIITSLLLIISVFFSISLLKEVIYGFYKNHSDNIIVSLILSRAIERYDIDNTNDTKTISFFGMPLEKDTELPMALFFSKRPYLYLNGYGLKNGGFISPDYYIFSEDDFKVVGSMSYSSDLRWYFFICEFGAITFFIWLFYFTNNFDSKVISNFENKYYTFLIAFLFFNGIELIIILIYSLFKGRIIYKPKSNLNLS